MDLATPAPEQGEGKILPIELTPDNDNKEDESQKPKWEEHAYYWISPNPQGTDEWLEDRKGRITMSRLGACCGHCPYNKNLSKTARQIAGLEKEEFSDYAKFIMGHGTKHEPAAREWYEKTHNVKVVEHGMALPKWYKYLGASVDGDVVGTDGIIEIKCPMKKLYPELKEFIRKQQEENFKPPPHYHEHIKHSHYDQMQGCMAVFKKKWCDYIVYCTGEQQVFTQRVLFNEKYWKYELYPAVQQFVECELKPLLEKDPVVPEGYTLQPELEFKGFD